MYIHVRVCICMYILTLRTHKRIYNTYCVHIQVGPAGSHSCRISAKIAGESMWHDNDLALIASKISLCGPCIRERERARGREEERGIARTCVCVFCDRENERETEGERKRERKEREKERERGGERELERARESERDRDCTHAFLVYCSWFLQVREKESMHFLSIACLLARENTRKNR